MALTILVVDDDPMIIELLIEALGDEGYLVRGCSTRQQALSVIESVPPDLLILDLHLADASGGLAFLETLRFRRATYDLPIIVYSSDQRFLQKYAARLGALGCSVLAKPFALESLASAVSHALATPPTHLPLSERAAGGG